MNEQEHRQLRKDARIASKANLKLFKQIKQKPPKNLDETVQALHEQAFAHIDCTTCANCCKTTSPRFLHKDIERLAKEFRINSGQFIEQYLRTDEDNDYVLKTTPCPFLADDNLCTVYDKRPNACRDYPYTNDRKFYRHLGITYENTFICPAVYEIVEQMQKIYAHVPEK